ncbi:TRAP transporter large permease subunit [Bosea psychrotolerans]|uniref:Tripartite ATP-independent transporter DctM subunit n=1 Tax=Bosea psychrotolerans TaxID=1871628 RepID=A0A2S4MHE1_9HYPH|nr:TRAP transporter large permease subunit [Bosea psychrotolerans]POR54152.1 tripartite ATP-independent transporter DctM subunit [Bosea psychrotolerans]
MTSLATSSLVPKPSLRRRAERGLFGLVAGLEWLGAIILAVLFAVVMAAVLRRYVFGGGYVWSDELAIWLNVALVAVGAPLAATSALAMRLDVIVRLLPAGAQRLASVFADAVAVHGSLVLACGGASVVALVGGSSTVLGLPEWLRFAAFAVGGGLTVVVVLWRAALDSSWPAALASLVLGIGFYLAAQSATGIFVETPSLVAASLAGLGLILGAPLPYVLLAGVSLSGAFGGLLPEPAIVQNTVSGVSKFLLLAIPFFLLAGELLTAGGLAERLVRFAASLVGHWRAGLAQTTLMSSVLFSGASGSSVANAAFGAKVMAPALIARGYPPAHAAAIVAGVSMLDNIIPPSIAFLILATATNLSVGSLLVGGFIAGGVLALALAIGIHLSVREVVDAAPKASGQERAKSFIGALPAIGLGVVVVVGIRFGVVTVTEASALAVAYALIACLALRSLNIGTVFGALRKSATEAAAVGMLIGASAPFAFLLAVDRVSDQMAGLVTALGGGPYAVMLLANLVLLVAGLFLDIGAAILLLAPLLLPVAISAGLDPIQFGVILVVNLMIHGLTPPLGILVYVVSGITRVPAGAVFRAVLPLLATLLVALAVLCLGAAAWPSFPPPFKELF